MKPNHYAKRKPTVVLLVEPDEEIKKLSDENGDAKVFPNYRSAIRYVYGNVDSSLHEYIEFVNEKPEPFSGDGEDTNFKKCDKCGSQLRISADSVRHRMPDGEVVEIDLYDCPKCDLNETEL